MAELLAREKRPSQLQDACFETKVPDFDKTIPMYISHPIYWLSDGESFNLEDVVVKFGGFGKGLIYHALNLSIATFADEDNETRRAIGRGAVTIAAPEVILALPSDATADIWSLGCTVRVHVRMVPNLRSTKF